MVHLISRDPHTECQVFMTLPVLSPRRTQAQINYFSEFAILFIMLFSFFVFIANWILLPIMIHHPNPDTTSPQQTLFDIVARKHIFHSGVLCSAPHTSLPSDWVETIRSNKLEFFPFLWVSPWPEQAWLGISTFIHGIFSRESFRIVYN